MTSNRLAVLGCWVVLLALEPVTRMSAGGALASDQELKQATFQIGMGSRAFLNVNRNDAEASFKVFINTAAKKRGYRIELVLSYFDTPTAFAAALTNQVTHLAAIDVWDYLDMNLGGFMEPRYILAKSGKPWQKYLLLTRSDSGLKSLADLRGKSIGLILANNARMAMTWIEAQLMESQLGKAGEFFGRIEIVDKPTLAVLPVFFGKKQACIVTQDGFAVMKELNPNVGRQLVPLLASDELTENIIFINTQQWTPPELKNDFLRAIDELHQDPAGQQILRLFKADQAVPFRAEYLETMRKLKATVARRLDKGHP